MHTSLDAPARDGEESILARLRRQTRVQHDSIERAVDLPARLQRRTAYATLLGRFHGFYRPLEQRLAAVGGLAATGVDLPARRKTELLVADLEALGHTPVTIAALPTCAALPALGGVAAALGCLYVVEGSTLGGRIIAREIRRAHGAGSDASASFFRGYGARTGAMWSALRRILDQECAREPAASDAIAAANDTFARLEAWLVEAPPC